MTGRKKKLYGATDRERVEYYREIAESGCWEWRGYRDPRGYGRITVGPSKGYAHRVAYEVYVGPIPDGLVIDHLCRNRGCCNPDHLRACTPRENTLAEGSRAPSAVCAAKTHCTRGGHEYTPENTRIDTGGHRRCRACDRWWASEQRRKAREAAA